MDRHGITAVISSAVSVDENSVVTESAEIDS